MIELKIEGYCHGCPNFESDVYKNYAGEYNRTAIFCKHHDKCASIKQYIEKQFAVQQEERTSYPIKSSELCHSCYYDLTNYGCKGAFCSICDMAQKPECPVDSDGSKSCYCTTLNDGEPCRYYKENKK